MIGSRWERLAAACGILFVALFAAGFLVGHAGVPDPDAPSRVVVAYFEDGATENKREVGAWMSGFAVFFLLVFLGGLRSALRRAGDQTRTFGSAALAGGIAMAVFMGLSAVLGVAVVSAEGFYDNYAIDANTPLLLDSLAFWLQGFGLVASGVLAGATSIVALTTGFLPRWFAIVGVVLAAVAFFGEFAQFIFVPLPLMLLWIAALSGILTRRAARAAVGEPRAGAALETRPSTPQNPR